MLHVRFSLVVALVVFNDIVGPEFTSVTLILFDVCAVFISVDVFVCSVDVVVVVMLRNEVGIWVEVGFVSSVEDKRCSYSVGDCEVCDIVVGDCVLSGADVDCSVVRITSVE